MLLPLASRSAMPRKRKHGQRVDPTGRSKGEARHARLYHWETGSAAFRSLEIGARALLLEFKALHNGSNNGSLFMSVREAAKRLCCSKNLAGRMLDQLQDRGFIRPNKKGGFNVKATRGGGAATTWILTEYPIGEAQGAGTRDFMRWPPPEEKHSAVPSQGRSVTSQGTATPARAEKRPDCPSTGDSLKRNRRSAVPSEVTQIVYHGRGR